MKNYPVAEEESKDFVTEFEICNDKLIVVFGDGHNIILENNEENVRKFLNKLEHQARISSKWEEQIKFQIKRIIKLLLYIFLGALIGAWSLASYGYSTTLMFLVMGFSTLVGGVKIKEKISIISDIKKNRTFLENKKKINEELIEHPTVAMNTTKKTQDVINRQGALSINDMDLIPYVDIAKILDNIDEYNTLGYVSPEREDRPFVMRPRKKTKKK